MRRISIISIILLGAALAVSACIVPTAPTEEGAARAGELLESVDEATQLDLERSAATGEAAEGIIGEAILEGANVREEEFYRRDLSFDFNDGCENVYQDTSLTIYQRSTVTGPLATVFSEHFFTGVADAVLTVNQHGGPCGVELLLQTVEAGYDPGQMPDLAALEMDETMPLFLLTYNRDAVSVVGEQMRNGGLVSPIDDPANVVLRMEPRVLYVPHGVEVESTLSTAINANQVTLAHRAFEDAGYGEGVVSYMMGYSSIFAVVEITQEILNRTGPEGVGDAAFFAVVNEETLEN